MSDKKTVSFEESLTELTHLVEAMEKGNLSLEQSLAHFEKGVGLIRHCQKQLTEAEQKVQILTQADASDGALADFSTEDA